MLLAFRPFKVGDLVEVNGEKASANIPGMIKDPAPQVFLKGLGGSSVDWQLRVWCKTEDFWDVWQAAVRACKASLDDAVIKALSN
jgi:small conductance mechanosensitive channel